MKISSIEFIFGKNEDIPAEELEDEGDRYSDRRIVIKVQSDYGLEAVNIDPCCGGYQQYGAPLDVIRFTSSTAQALNPWLHGGELNALYPQD